MLAKAIDQGPATNQHDLKPHALSDLAIWRTFWPEWGLLGGSQPPYYLFQLVLSCLWCIEKPCEPPVESGVLGSSIGSIWGILERNWTILTGHRRF